MANMAPSRIGSINAGSDKDALFLKVFVGEVLTAFAETNVAMSRQMIRTITSGKSAQFPASWKGTASYHTPGAQLTGTAVGHAERIIVIDDLLVADRFIANIDEAKNHYDVRQTYSTDIGAALARKFDQQSLQTMVLAARASATLTGASGGTRLIDGDFDDTVADLEAGIFAAAQALDEKDVPENERYVFLKPAQYYLLVQGSSKVINADYNPTPNGGYATGTVKQIAGCEIVKTNNLPRADVTTGPEAYQGNFTSNVGLVTQRGAAGTVKLMDLAMESEYLIEYQGTLMVGKYALGHGILRPECAVELALTATS
jgi:hypothetical protein